MGNEMAFLGFVWLTFWKKHQKASRKQRKAAHRAWHTFRLFTAKRRGSKLYHLFRLFD